MDQPQRLIAYKAWISDLLQGEYTKGSGEFDPGIVHVRDLNVSRVNLIASVVEKYAKEDQSYANLVIDDSSGYLHVKTWKENTKLLTPVNVGDIVLIIGKIKEYNSLVYVNPEIIKKLDNPLWAKLRRLELTHLYGEPTLVEQEHHAITQEPSPAAVLVEERVQDDSPNKRQTILSLIEALSAGEGADRKNVITTSKLFDADVIIQELLKEGEIFEASPGKLKIIT